MINNRLHSRQLKPQFQAKNKSILAISNVDPNPNSNETVPRPMLIDYNGQWVTMSSS